MGVYQVYLHRGDDEPLFVATSICWKCRKEVTISHVLTGDMHPVKMWGDSENGYELWHRSCL